MKQGVLIQFRHVVSPCRCPAAKLKTTVWKHKSSGAPVQHLGEAYHENGIYRQKYVIHRNSPQSPLQLTHAEAFYYRHQLHRDLDN